MRFPNHHIRDCKEQNTSSPHSYSLSLLILPRWTVELDGVFSAREHLRYTHFVNDVVLGEKKIFKLEGFFFYFILWKWKVTREFKLQYKCFTYAEAPVLLPRLPKSLTHFVWKHCLSTNDLSWVEKRSKLVIHSFYRDRGDMAIAQPLLALESPLLLLLPPVFVAQARLHSGFQR